MSHSACIQQTEALPFLKHCEIVDYYVYSVYEFPFRETPFNFVPADTGLDFQDHGQHQTIYTWAFQGFDMAEGASRDGQS